MIFRAPFVCCVFFCFALSYVLFWCAAFTRVIVYKTNDVCYHFFCMHTLFPEWDRRQAVLEKAEVPLPLGAFMFFYRVDDGCRMSFVCDCKRKE